MDADDLYDAVLTRIQECAKAVIGDGTELENRVKELCEEDTQGHRDSLEKLVSKQKDRLETLDRLIAKLYDDLINDKITESVFDKMLEKTQKEQADIKKELSQNRRKKTEQKITAVLLKRSQWKFISSKYFLIKDIKQLKSRFSAHYMVNYSYQICEVNHQHLIRSLFRSIWMLLRWITPKLSKRVFPILTKDSLVTPQRWLI